MVSGRKKGDINKKTAVGMNNVQVLFKDKGHWINGLTKDEFISLEYNIPLKNVLNMTRSNKEQKWNEIGHIRKYLRNTLNYAIEFIPISKGVELNNKEFGSRILKNRTNIYFRVTDISDASVIKKRYKKQAQAYSFAGDNVEASAEKYQKEIPARELLTIKNAN